MITNFRIGPVKFSVLTEINFSWKNDVEIFRDYSMSQASSLQYEVYFMEEFTPLWGNVLYQDASMTVMKEGNIEHRIHFLSNSIEPYALTSHMGDKQVCVYIHKNYVPYIKWDRNLIGLFSLEHYFLPFDSFLLHASYIIYHGKAIIFTAPSGTGKSTQADLWKQYEGAEIINGDRTLLFRYDNKWYASGFPVCGSSEYCENRIAPVQAVICLEKGIENSIQRLEGINAWKKIYSQAFVNIWNSDDCKLAGDLVTSLVVNSRIYNYSCTKEKDAVDYLNQYLEFEIVKGSV